MVAEIAQLQCDENLVELLYGVLLGRAPESKDLWIGAPLQQAAETIIESDEFQQVAAPSLALTFTPPQSVQKASTRRRLADALASRGAPAPRSNDRYDLLLSGLDWLMPVLSPSLAEGVAEPVASAIRQHFVPTVEIDDVLDAYVQFDRTWFERAHAGAINVVALDDAAFESLVVDSVLSGRADLVAHFTTSGKSNDKLRARVFGGGTATTIGQLLRRLREAAAEGTVEHWLFDEAYYLQRRAAAHEACGSNWAPLQSAYMDFLGNGDREGIRPHPLFCPVAYRLLNSGVEEGENPFTHFLVAGQFDGARTSALFDPDFYLSLNPLSVQDVVEGVFASPLESFAREGLEEGRPCLPDFDQDFYLAHNDGLPPSAKSNPGAPARHFLFDGANDGLGCNPFFDPPYYLRRNPAVAEECERLRLAPIEHFLLLGKARGLLPCAPLADREVDIDQAKGLYERRASEALARLDRQPLDFGLFAGDGPLLSVVVPVRNQVAFTARFLELAHAACAELSRRIGRPTELIFVSNGSTDATARLLRATGGIVVEEFPDAIGFTKAANIGARAATGDYILIANNDVEFAPTLFADIVQSMDGDVTCGALGVKVLSMDMTVQEVGAVLSRNGETRGRGRGAPSLAFKHDRKRVVDYVSGCFLLIRRSDFEALGGFDEDFSPGYYEDVDLCLRIVRNLGKTAMVDPNLAITHYENASFMGGRPQAAVFPLVLRNRQKLLRKHRDITSRLAASMARVLIIADAAAPEDQWVVEALCALGMPYDILALDPAPTKRLSPADDDIILRGWMPGQGLEDVLGRASDYSHIWVRGLSAFNAHSATFRELRCSGAPRLVCEIGRLLRSTPEIGLRPDQVDVAAAILSQIGLADLVIVNDRETAESVSATGLAKPVLLQTTSGAAEGMEPSDLTEQLGALLDQQE